MKHSIADEQKVGRYCRYSAGKICTRKTRQDASSPRRIGCALRGSSAVGLAASLRVGEKAGLPCWPRKGIAGTMHCADSAIGELADGRAARATRMVATGDVGKGTRSEYSDTLEGSELGGTCRWYTKVTIGCGLNHAGIWCSSDTMM